MNRKLRVGIVDALDFTVPGLISQESIRCGSVPLPVPDFRAMKKFPDELPRELQNACVMRVREEMGK